MRRRLALALLLALGGALRAAPPASPSLEGTQWKMRPHSFMAKIVFWRFDQLSFRNGLFQSRDWTAKGFAPAPFVSSTPGDTLAWTASMAGPDRGKVVWEGRRDRDRMEGTWTWRRPDGTSKSMSWSAKRTD